MFQPDQVFRALSDNTRLRILRLLQARGPALCVCEMVDALKVPQYKVSRHLSVLKYAGLVGYKRKGAWAYYSLNTEERNAKVLFRFLKNFLPDETRSGRKLP